MAKKKKTYAEELPKENTKLVPYGTNECRICCLPYESLKEVHALKFDKKQSYAKVREYLKEKFNIGNDYSYLVTHFKKHATYDKAMLLKGVKGVQPIAEILLGKDNSVSKIKHDEKIENAYSQLLNMTTTFVNATEKIFNFVGEKINDDKELQKIIDDMGALESLDLVSKLHQIVRSQVKDISSLRAPKVLVMQFLEDYINKSIFEFNLIFTNMCSLLQADIFKMLKEKNIDIQVNDSTFVGVFKAVASQYKDKVLMLRRDQLSKAASALSEIEKVV